MKWSLLKILFNPIDYYFDRKRRKAIHAMLAEAQKKADLMRLMVCEHDVNIEYQEGDMALFNGELYIYFKNIHRDNKMEWVRHGVAPYGYVEVE